MFEYSLRIEDRVAFNLWLLGANGKARKQERWLWWVCFAGCTLIAVLPMPVLFYSIPVATLPLQPRPLLAWLLSALVWPLISAVWPGIPRTLLTRRIAKQVKRALRKKPNEPIRLRLDRDGLNVGSAAGQSHFAWSVILGVGETRDHIFILSGKEAGFILPKRVDPPGVAVFAEQVRAAARSSARGAGTAPAPPQDTVANVSAGPAGPEEWIPPVGVVPLSAFSAGGTAPPPPASPAAAAAAAAASFPTTALPMLTFTISIDDLMAAVLDFPPRLKARERLILKAGWRRWAVLTLDGFVLILACNLFLVRLELAPAVFSAVACVGLFALVRWSRLDHTIRRRLPLAVEKEAAYDLAGHSEQRRIWADATGLTIADAVLTQQIPWGRVQLVETDLHVIVGTELTSIAIPRHVGRPLLDFLRFARSCGVG